MVQYVTFKKKASWFVQITHKISSALGRHLRGASEFVKGFTGTIFRLIAGEMMFR